MIVKYTGPAYDYSGYGEASRHHLGALNAVGIDVILEKVNYTAEPADFGNLTKLADSMRDNTGKYDIKLLHTTPDQFKMHMEKGKYHIGFCYWETDKIPKDFADGCKLMDEIWTGSKANKQAIKAAGVEVPVHIFPQAIETDRPKQKPYEIDDFDGYLFYSVFEWIDRKNPTALIKAYYQAFKNNENVGLLLKTYYRNFTITNKKMIRHQIDRIKSELGYEKYPPIFLYLDLMDRSQIERLHSTGDCFVSAHRGEGWGIPQAEAMLYGKPIISTNYAGVHEYLTDKENALLIRYKMINVSGMMHSVRWYSNDQKWADIEIGDMAEAMKYVFDHQDNKIGTNAAEFVKQHFNFKEVGKQFKQRLDAIKGAK